MCSPRLRVLSTHRTPSVWQPLWSGHCASCPGSRKSDRHNPQLIQKSQERCCHFYLHRFPSGFTPTCLNSTAPSRIISDAKFHVPLTAGLSLFLAWPPSVLHALVWLGTEQGRAGTRAGLSCLTTPKFFRKGLFHWHLDIYRATFYRAFLFAQVSVSKDQH